MIKSKFSNPPTPSLEIPFPSINREISAYKVSSTNVDFPDPETPVIEVKCPSGISTSIFLRLFRQAPSTLNHCVLWDSTDLVGIESITDRLPSRYSAVRPQSTLNSLALPKYSIDPPLSPASGPISNKKSAARIICGSCSTTTIVFPFFLSRLITEITLSISLGCSPIEGSSSKNNVCVSEAPNAVAKFSRWVSPPDKVRDCRSKVRYPSPTSSRKSNLDRIWSKINWLESSLISSCQRPFS